MIEKCYAASLEKFLHTPTAPHAVKNIIRLYGLEKAQRAIECQLSRGPKGRIIRAASSFQPVKK